MPDSVFRHPRLLIAAFFTALVFLGAFVAAQATGTSVSSLNGQLSQTQSHEQSLSDSISSLDGQVSKLNSQIGLVEKREAVAAQTLDQDKDALARSKAQLVHEKQVFKREKVKLALAQKILRKQLVNQYEQPQQSLVSVVLDSHGFSQLLSQLRYLRSAQKQQQAIIDFTRKAKEQTVSAEQRISKLEQSDATAADHARLQVNAMSGMKTLLSNRQDALSHTRAAQAAALAASKAHGAALQTEISQAKAQEEAAQRAAEEVAPPAAPSAPASAPASNTTITPSAPSTTTTPAPAPSSGSFPYDGWAIPYAIVLCESGGQNLPPNSAGASGYYQIMPATWKGDGGSGPAAYLASKAEQSAVASRIWDGGAGSSNWVCASIVGYK